MTTGNILRDDRTIHQNTTQTTGGPPTVTGTSLVGAYYSKAWNGADQVSTGKYRYEEHSFTDIRGRVHRKRFRVGLQNNRNPLEPHVYSMQLTSSLNTLTTRVEQWFHPTIPEANFTVTVIGGTAQVGSNVAVDPFTANDQLNLIDRLKAEILGSDFNIAVSLGESKEAFQMVGATAKKLATAFVLIKRGQYVNAASTLGVLPPARSRKALASFEKKFSKDAGGAWLEYRYGWVPLLSDVRSAALFAARHFEAPIRKVYRVQMRNNATVTTDPVNYSASGYGYRTRRIIALVDEINEVAALGLTDPASLAWELLPFSFVADWFLPVGDWLSARAAVNAFTGTFITTDKLVLSRTLSGYVGKRFFSSPYTVVTSASGFSRTTNVNVGRDVSSTLFVPKPNFKSPLSDAKSPWKRALDAVTLLQAVFRK